MKGYSELPHPEDQLLLITSAHSVLTVDQKTPKIPWENFQSLDKTCPIMPHMYALKKIKINKKSRMLLQACKVYEFNTHTHTYTHLPEPPAWAWRDGSNLFHSACQILRAQQSLPTVLTHTHTHVQANSPLLPLSVLCMSRKPDALTDSIFYRRYRVTMGIPRSLSCDPSVCTRSSISLPCHSVALILSRCQKNTEYRESKYKSESKKWKVSF